MSMGGKKYIYTPSIERKGAVRLCCLFFIKRGLFNKGKHNFQVDSKNLYLSPYLGKEYKYLDMENKYFAFRIFLPWINHDFYSQCLYNDLFLS